MISAERLMKFFEEEGLKIETPSPEELAQRREEGRQIAMLEPSLVTHCLTCGCDAYMARLGCANRECSDQPMAVNVVYQFINYQGHRLRPGRDWMPLEWRPLTDWT